MPRNNLLKKAFRNNFIRKSVADLKSLTADKADAKLQDTSPKNLRSRYQADAPVTPSSRTSTLDLPDLEPPVSKKENSDIDPFVEDTPIKKEPNETLKSESVQYAHFPTPGPYSSEEALDDVDPMTMTPSQVRHIMDKEHEELKASVRSLLANEQTSAKSSYTSAPDLSPDHEQLMSDCEQLHASLEAMIDAHIDTLAKTMRVLKAIENLSPHVEYYKEDMAVKSQMCHDMRMKIMPVKKRLANLKAGKRYA